MNCYITHSKSCKPKYLQIIEQSTCNLSFIYQYPKFASSYDLYLFSSVLSRLEAIIYIAYAHHIRASQHLIDLQIRSRQCTDGWLSFRCAIHFPKYNTFRNTRAMCDNFYELICKDEF